jgi:hypothetical protein
MPNHDVFKITQVADGAAGTAHSGHYTGTGAVTTAMGGFGAGTVYNAAIDTTHDIYCVGISAFDGVSFWAKAGPNAISATPTVSLNFVIPATNATSVHGDCTANCFNHPNVAVTLSTTWQQYTVTFAQSNGTGGANVDGVIQELGWLTPDSNWDFYVDEIAFYKGTPPAGAVAP